MDSSSLNERNILVFGDIMLDHYIYGDCNRISPEAPVPIVEVKSEQYELGGAGNVIKNLSSFGCNSIIVCVIGQDESAGIISSKLSEYNLAKEGFITDVNRCTTIKTRILVNKHQLIRLDREVVNPIDNNTEKKVLKAISELVTGCQIMLISDYNKGLLTPTVLREVFKVCKNQNIKTIVDPKGVDFTKYKGATIIKPNKKEAMAATGIVITDEQTLLQACIRIKEITSCEDVIITMSEEGIALYSKEKLTIIPTKALDIVDVTGAGDTVLAALGISAILGKTLHEACEFANRAAAIVVSKVGSATATLEEIEKSFLFEI